jgi:hypothetical protein
MIDKKKFTYTQNIMEYIYDSRLGCGHNSINNLYIVMVDTPVRDMTGLHSLAS